MGKTLKEVVDNYILTDYFDGLSDRLQNQLDEEGWADYQFDGDVVVAIPGSRDMLLTPAEVFDVVSMYVGDGTALLYKGWKLGNSSGSLGFATRDGENLSVLYETTLSYDDVSRLIDPLTDDMWNIVLYPTSQVVDENRVRELQGKGC